MNISYHAAGFMSGYTREGTSGRIYTLGADLAPDFGYGYNTRGRMTRWTLGGQDINFDYDDASNLTSHDGFQLDAQVTNDNHGTEFRTCSLAGMVARYYDANNRRPDWSYDLDGAVTRDDQWSYRWDKRDNLDTILDGDFTAAQYRYDADGNRVRAACGAYTEYSARLPDGRLITTEVTWWRQFAHAGQLYLLSSPAVAMAKDFVWHNGKVLVEMTYYDDWRWDLEYQFRDYLGSPVFVISSTVDFRFTATHSF